MSLKTVIFSTTSLVFLTGAASADVTAKNIWDDWKTYMSGFGYDVEASEAMSGNTLTVSDLTMAMDMPEDAGKFSMTLSKIDFVENGDGTVNLLFPEVTPMTFELSTPEGEAVSGSLDYTLRGMNMVASGDPSNVNYVYTADQLGLALNELVVDGETFNSDTFTAEFTSQNVSGSSTMELAALRKITQDMKTGTSTYTLNIKMPDSDDAMAFNGTIDSLNYGGVANIPATMNPDNMAETLASGFAVDGRMGYSGSSTKFAITEDGDTMNGTSSVASAEIAVRMDKDALAYSGGSNDVSVNVVGGEVPFPIVMQFGEVAFNLLMPVAKSETPSDFAFGLTLGEFATSDDLWALFDGGGVLPRDPATISLDLTGKAKLLFDLFDPDQMAAIENGETMPGELNAITLQKLLVSVAGATLSGTGDFTFDNSDLESFDGFPKPTGGIDLSLVGGNGLMDKLVQMGLLPEEQAMGARMMMGLFTRPGEGEDSLTSKIEINEEGHILANGQRVQ